MKISIITPTYNCKPTIRETFNSVLRQSFSDYEMIVVDGDSTDGTQELLREYEPQFLGRMRWISEPDKGLYDAMNKGIKMATGDVVGIINSDDYYDNDDAFIAINSAFEDNPSVQAIYGDVRFVHPQNLNKTVRYYSGNKFRLWKMRWGWFPAHPTFFTYRKFFEEYGYYHEDYKIAADYELIMRFFLSKRLTFMYVPALSLTMRTGGKTYRGGIQNMMLINKEKIRACKENGIYTNTIMLLTRYFGKLWEVVVARHTND